MNQREKKLNSVFDKNKKRMQKKNKLSKVSLKIFRFRKINLGLKTQSKEISNSRGLSSQV